MTDLSELIVEVASDDQASSERAFAELDSLFRPKVRAGAFRLCVDQYYADDLTQEVLFRAFKGLRSGRYVIRSSSVSHEFSGWLFRILRGLWIDQVRSTQQRRLREKTWAKSNQRKGKMDERIKTVLTNISDSLTPRQRLVASFRYGVEKATLVTIAKRVGCSRETVSKDLRRVRDEAVAYQNK